MGRTREIVAAAVRLAGRDSGVTAGELSEVATCPLRTAQRQLQRLAGDGILTREIPLRLGRKRGGWRIVYRASKAPTQINDVMVIATIGPKTTDAELGRMAKEIVAKLTPARLKQP